MAVETINCRDKNTWLERRRKLGLGGSESPVAMGQVEWRSEFELYHIKIGVLEDSEETERMKWGSALEAPIRKEVKSLLKTKIINPGKYVIQRNTKYQHLFCTLDGIIPEVTPEVALLFQNFEMDPPEGPGVLEIKTADKFMRKHWGDEFPVPYQIQTQHNMLVPELKWGILPVLIGGNEFQMYPFKPHEEFSQLLVDRTQDFWQCVLDLTPPPVDAKESTARAIRKIYPEGSIVDLPPESINWDNAYRAADEEEKRAREKKQLAANLLSNAIGSHTYGRTPAGVVYSFKTQKRKAFKVEESTTRVLRRDPK